jgi:hypothetical protein
MASGNRAVRAGASLATLKRGRSTMKAHGTRELYRDLGADYYTRQNPDRITKRLIRQLEALGHHVTLEPREAAA